MSPSVFGAIASRAAAGGAPSSSRHDGERRDRSERDRCRQRGEQEPAAWSPVARTLAAHGRRACRGELGTAGVAVAGRLRERPRQDVVEARGEAGPDVARAWRGLVDVGVDRCELALARERRLARQALEEHAPERVDVCPRVDGAALDLLG